MQKLPIELTDKIVIMAEDSFRSFTGVSSLCYNAFELWNYGVISEYVYIELEKRLSKRHKIMSKLEEASLDKLQLIYSEQFKKYVRNLKNTKIRLVVRREGIIRYIIEAIEQSNDEQISQKIIDRYFPNKYLKRKRVEGEDDEE